MKKADHQIGDGPIDERYVAMMNAIAKSLDEVLNGDKARTPDATVGFVLMVFPFGDVAGRTNYISNARREDIVVLLKEQLARFEGQPEVKGHA
jgi:hypothetical protein